MIVLAGNYIKEIMAEFFSSIKYVLQWGLFRTSTFYWHGLLGLVTSFVYENQYTTLREYK